MNQQTEQRLQTERNIWMATVRSDGRPHLVPVWFVWQNGRFYIGMQPASVKARNLAHNPHIALSLEDGTNVVICEGTAVVIPTPYPPAIINQFKAKYDWDISTDREYGHLIGITPAKWLTWTGIDAADG